MASPSIDEGERAGRSEPAAAGGILPPLPPFAPALLNPLMNRMVRDVAGRHPELFSRLGEHAAKRFLIDPENLPFVLLLRPDPERPRLEARRRDADIAHDACIAGSFLALFDLIDARLDGDALFFTRELRVSGDTEAVVALRNALDDLDESLADSLPSAFGFLSPPASLALSVLRALRRSHGHGRV